MEAPGGASDELTLFGEVKACILGLVALKAAFVPAQSLRAAWAMVHSLVWSDRATWP